MGWVCIFYFFSSLGNSFSKHNIPSEEKVQLTNAKVDLLELTASPKMRYYEDKWFQITPFSDLTDDDTVFVRNLRVRIVQSKSDSFEVKMVKLSNGKTIQEANALAQKINLSLMQQDSVLLLDRGIGINKIDKFRNQHIILTIAVPIGKRILITNKGWSQTNVRVNGHGIQTETLNGISDGWYDEWNEKWDNDSYAYEQGVEYRMTSSGLEKTKRINESISNDKDDKDPADIDDKIEKLKEERLQLEKSKSEKLNEDRKDKKADAGTSRELKKVSNAAGKLTDIHWVLERFSY